MNDFPEIQYRSARRSAVALTKHSRPEPAPVPAGATAAAAAACQRLNHDPAAVADDDHHGVAIITPLMAIVAPMRDADHDRDRRHDVVMGQRS